MSEQQRPGVSQRLQNAWRGLRSFGEGVTQQPGGSILGAPEAGPMEFTEPTEDELGRGAYEPYVSPPFRLAAAWSWRGLVVLAAVGVALWLLSQITMVLIPALVALLIAALLTPLNSFLQKHRWPRGLSTAAVFLGFIVLVVGILTLVGQQIVVGFQDLSDQVVAGFLAISDWLNSNPFGIDSSLISEQVDAAIDQGVQYLEDNASNLAGGAAGAVTSVGTFLTGLVLALFTAFFFLLDGRRMFSWGIGLLPRPARAKTEGALLRGWQTLVQYVRVQIIVAAVDAVGIGIGAFFLGLPLVIPLTLLVFMASFVPVVGAVLTGIIAVLVALVSQGFVSALIMLAIVLAVQQIESNVLQPFIMGKAVSVHPLAVLLAVAAGGFLFGIVGALFAVPVIAVANTIVRFLAGHDIFASDADGGGDDPPKLERELARRHGAEADPAGTAAAGQAGADGVPVSSGPDAGTASQDRAADSPASQSGAEAGRRGEYSLRTDPGPRAAAEDGTAADPVTGEGGGPRTPRPPEEG
ncbi:AI-2E family transporter [Brevibacterium album]|uniref:AI-2E family transporter n=1 Tax=Brevibacterium album TaxID=417948 RepID=UPI000404F96A|nr:AI-2E family transporter [Brevibacterium album]